MAPSTRHDGSSCPAESGSRNVVQTCFSLSRRTRTDSESAVRFTPSDAHPTTATRLVFLALIERTIGFGL